MIFLTNWHSKVLAVILSIFVVILIWVSTTLSISYKEAIIFYEGNDLLHYIIQAFTYLFGQNSVALRLPFIIFYIASVVLMYKMTENYFKNENDRLISILVFMFLPGIVGASLLVNNSIIVIFCTILYLYSYRVTSKHNYYMLALFLFIDNSFAILFLTLFFYALQKRLNELLVVSLILFGLSMSIYGFDVNAFEEPRSHFLDLFAIYAYIFSPFVFFYFIYSMYRVGIKGKKTIFWYTSVTVLIFSFLLSFRQRIQIEDFAPFVIVTIPLMMKIYFHSLRVRLPMFRDKYLIGAYISLVFLAISTIALLFNKPLYYMLKEQKNHFAYQYHFVNDIAKILKQNNITSVMVNDKKLALRLKFYGIEEDKTNFITLNQLNIYDKKFDILFLNKNIQSLYYVKINEPTE